MYIKTLSTIHCLGQQCLNLLSSMYKCLVEYAQLDYTDNIINIFLYTKEATPLSTREKCKLKAKVEL